jgi:hypothetical protein
MFHHSKLFGASFKQRRFLGFQTAVGKLFTSTNRRTHAGLPDFSWCMIPKPEKCTK